MFWILSICFGLYFPLGGSLCQLKNCSCDDTKVTCDDIIITEEGFHILARDIPKNTTQLSFQRSNLTTFDLEYFPFLPNLTRLILRSNLLTYIPDNLATKMPKLEVLDLKDNTITESSSNFKGLQHLITLKLSENNIKTLTDDMFKDLPNLQKLILNGNKMSTMSSGALQGLHHISSIDLSNNMLKTVPSKFFDQINKTSSIVISLADNQLTEIPNNLFNDQHNIISLDLGWNNISKIADKAFFNSTFEKGLSLEGNKLQFIPLSAVQYMYAQHILLYNNPLHCDCSFYKLLQILKNQSSLIDGTCMTPATLKNRQIADITSVQKAMCTVCDLQSPCLNDGTCISLNQTNYKCNCTHKYEGNRCEMKKVSALCEENYPCKNNGICVLINHTNYTCNCTKMYTGENCGKYDGGNQAKIWIAVGVCIVSIALVVIFVAIFIYHRHVGNRERNKNEYINMVDG